tara:strand:+ start:8990 stop:11182 length:2193 start_codon:yes stop_codon:yes gene_type:complete
VLDINDMVTWQECRKAAVWLIMLGIVVSFFAVSVLAFADYTPREVCYKQNANDNYQYCTSTWKHNLLDQKTATNILCESVRKDPMISVLRYTIHAHDLFKHVKTTRQSIFGSQKSATTDVLRTSDVSTTTVTESVSHTDNNDIYHILWIVIIGISLLMTCIYHGPFVYVTPLLMILYATILSMITANVSDQCELQVVEVQLGLPTNKLLVTIYLLSMAATMIFCEVTAIGTILTVLCIVVCYNFNVYYGTTAYSLMLMCDIFCKYRFYCASFWYVKELIGTCRASKNMHIFLHSITIVVIIGAACLENLHSKNYRHQKEEQSWGKALMNFMPQQNMSQIQRSVNEFVYGIPCVGKVLTTTELTVEAVGSVVQSGAKVADHVGDTVGLIPNAGTLVIFSGWVVVIVVVVISSSCLACCCAYHRHVAKKGSFVVDTLIGTWVKKSDIENERQKAAVGFLSNLASMQTDIMQTLQDPDLTAKEKIEFVQLTAQLMDASGNLLEHMEPTGGAFTEMLNFIGTMSEHSANVVIALATQNANAIPTRGRNANSNSRAGNNGGNAPPSRQARTRSPCGQSRSANGRGPAPNQMPRQVPLQFSLLPLRVEKTNFNQPLQPPTHVEPFSAFGSQVPSQWTNVNDVKFRDARYKSTPGVDETRVVMQVLQMNGNALTPQQNWDPQNTLNCHGANQYHHLQVGQNIWQIHYDSNTKTIEVILPHGTQTFKALHTSLQKMKF